jgi:hypothetical protein
MTDKARSSSFFTFLCLIIIVLVFQQQFRNDHRWERQSVLVWDVQEYYSYLPAAFIYHDLSFRFIDELPDTLKIHYAHIPSPQGGYLTTRSMGMAVAYLPFFFIGHISAILHKQPLTGFSEPYQFWIAFSGLLYSILGLYFTQKLLLRFFNGFVTGCTLLCIALGTNLLYYAICEGGMSHSFLYFMFAVLLYNTVIWYSTFRFRNLFWIAMALGLATLARPTSILAIIIFLFYGISNADSLKKRIRDLKAHFRQILLCLPVLILLALPQLLYWKIHSGQWLFYSYQDQHFFFKSPHILKGLFSYRKGWFIYTPVMLMGMAGLLVLKRFNKDALLPLLLFMVLNIYLTFSWWCWWYGGSFGMRALIESYAFLAFPLAASFAYAFRHWAISLFIVLFSAGCIWLNIFQTWQYRNGILHFDSMNEKTYWLIFGRDGYAPHEETMLSPPDYDKALKTGHE